MKTLFGAFVLTLLFTLTAHAQETSKAKKAIDMVGKELPDGWSGAVGDGLLLTSEGLTINRHSNRIYAAWKRVMPEKVERYEVMNDGVNKLSNQESELRYKYNDLLDEYEKARDGWTRYYDVPVTKFVYNHTSKKNELITTTETRSEWIPPKPEVAKALKPEVDAAHAEWKPVEAKLKQAEEALAIVEKDLIDSKKKFLADEMNRKNPDYSEIKSSKNRIKFGSVFATLAALDLIRRGIIAIIDEDDAETIKIGPRISKAIDLSYMEHDERTSELKKTEIVNINAQKKVQKF